MSELVYRYRINRSLFSRIFESANTLVDEVTIEINQDGFVVRTMDPSHIALIDIVLSKNDFISFVEPEGEAIKFGLRSEEMLKLIKQFKPVDKNDNEDITLELVDNKLVITKQTNDGDKIQGRIHRIEPSSGTCPLPKLTYNVDVPIPTPKLSRQIESLSQVGEYLKLSVDIADARGSECKITFSTTTDGIDQSNTITIEDSGSIVRETSQAVYSLDYIQKMVRTMKFAEQVTVQYSTKMPLRLVVKLGAMSFIHFYLAPRVQD